MKNVVLLRSGRFIGLSRRTIERSDGLLASNGRHDRYSSGILACRKMHPLNSGATWVRIVINNWPFTSHYSSSRARRLPPDDERYLRVCGFELNDERVTPPARRLSTADVIILNGEFR